MGFFITFVKRKDMSEAKQGKIKPYIPKDYVVFQVEAEAQELFFKVDGEESQIVKAIDRFSWKNKTNHGTVVSVPKTLTDKIWISPMRYTKKKGRPEPIRRVTSKFFKDRINAYKESISKSSIPHSVDHFHSLVDDFRARLQKGLKYSATNYKSTLVAHDIWEMELKEGDTIFFDHAALDYNHKLDYSSIEQPYYKIVYDRIIGYQRGEDFKTICGHVLLEPLMIDVEEVRMKKSALVNLLGENEEVTRTETVKKEVLDEGIVRFLPEHTVFNESIGCQIGERVKLKENAAVKVEVNGTTYLKIKYQDILGVITKERQ